MYESISAEPSFAFSIVLAAIFFGTLTLTVLGVAGMIVWRRHQATKMANEMKMELLSQGMSADEIERVLAAKASGK